MKVSRRAVLAVGASTDGADRGTVCLLFITVEEQCPERGELAKTLVFDI